MKNTRISFIRKFTVADRRRLTSQLYLTNRYDIPALALELHERYDYPLSESTVALDLKIVKARNLEVAGRSIAEWVEIELTKLDHLEELVMRSQNVKFAVEKIDEEKDLDVVAAVEEAESLDLGLDTKTADILIKIADRRTKLLGLDAPKKIAVEGGDPSKPIKVSDLTDEAIEAFLLANKPNVN